MTLNERQARIIEMPARAKLDRRGRLDLLARVADAAQYRTSRG